MTNDFYYPTGGKGAPPEGERRMMGNRRHDAMAIVGGPNYQAALRSLLDRHGRSLVASLIPDPENPKDPNAVAVVVKEQTIGYLPADVAKRYGPVIKALATPMRCPAELHGGEWDVPYINVTLNFSQVYAASRGT